MAQVYFSSQSRKIFNKIKEKKIKDRITLSLQKLSQNPYAGKKLQGKLEGTYSLRIWPYRILYEFMDDNNIIVTDIGQRKDIYR